MVLCLWTNQKVGSEKPGTEQTPRCQQWQEFHVEEIKEQNSMKNMYVKFTFLLLLSFLFNSSYSQETILVSSNKTALAGLQQKPENPFKKFIGEWTLKDDNWSQNWGNGTENIKIPNHHTVCKELNTANSLLAVIDGTPPYGHIFWSYNPVKKEVDHLSSFGTTRAGVG